MPVYTYTARDQSGAQQRGSLEAENNARAVALLREQGLWVTDLRPTGGARVDPNRAESGSTAKGMFSPVSLKDQALFFRQLHTMLKSGMAIYQSLEILCGDQQTPNPALRRVIVQLAQQVLAGGRLSEVMRRFPWLFSKMQVRMVEAGETGGLLVEVLERLADYLEREYAIRQEIKRKTLYPKLVLLALIFIPPVPTLVLRGLIPYIFAVWSTVGLILLFGVPIWLGIRFALTTEMGRNLYDQIKLAVPYIGMQVRKMAAARFSRCLAALYGAGVPIATAISIAGESSGNSILERDSRVMVPAIERGIPISQALSSSKFFPPMYLGMVSTGESTGNLDGMLDKGAEFYEQESSHAITQMLTILPVVLLIVLGILVAINLIGAYSGYAAGIGGFTGE